MEITAKEILQQLDRWISIQVSDGQGDSDYTRALRDFRDLITRSGPYSPKGGYE